MLTFSANLQVLARKCPGTNEIVKLFRKGRFVPLRCPAFRPLKGRHFNVSAFGVAPYVIFNGKRIAGVDQDVFKILGQIFGFTFAAKWGRSFGSRDPKTGLFNGITREAWMFQENNPEV